MNPEIQHLGLQAIQTGAYCFMVHWVLWEHCKSYREWLKQGVRRWWEQLVEKLKQHRTALSGRLASDVGDALEQAGL